MSHQESDKSGANVGKGHGKQGARGCMSGLGACAERRALTMDDVNHYQRVVLALKETFRLMG